MLRSLPVSTLNQKSILMEKILCDSCKELKSKSSFRLRQHTQEKPVCIKCAGWQGRKHAAGLRLSIKNRKCVNCGNPFNSMDGNRYCNSCKRTWKDTQWI